METRHDDLKMGSSGLSESGCEFDCIAEQNVPHF